MIKETFKQAVQNVLSNKVRTFLTMLGIIIGVMAVIVIVGLGNGMTHMMQDFYSDMGSDILAVNVMTASTRTVEVSDVYNIINQKPEYYKGLSPIASVGDTLRVAGEKYRRTYISGVNEDYTTINNYKVAKGRGIQYTDLIDNKNICVIGDYVDRRIFGGNGLGSTLKVGASEYRIVGVLEGRSRPAAQYEGGNDDIVLIPYTTLMSVNNTSSVSQYYVVLQDADHSDEAQEYMQKSIKKLVSKDDYVYVQSLSAAMKQMSSMINVMVGVLTAIAGISLLVGGIGIMNIMLVSVTERTREIGIRKALGAQESTILTQFVVEAGVTSALGGCLGIVLGYVVSAIINQILPYILTDITLNVTPSADAAAIAVGISCGIGVLFGLERYHYEFAALLMHAEHLEAVHGVGPHTISVPRVKRADDIDPDEFGNGIDDETFAKICACLRLAVPYTGMIISTRESKATREKVIRLGVSQISGASKTSVGGYGSPDSEEENSAQFDVSDNRTLDEVVCWLMELGFIPSFCTACYREGRTGDRFMALCKSGRIADCCHPNALMTLKEYLEDYASEQARRTGSALLRRELGNIPNERIRHIAAERLEKIAAGQRDFRF